jgi:DNA-binding GntR family transcriptional regulator
LTQTRTAQAKLAPPKRAKRPVRAAASEMPSKLASRADETSSGVVVREIFDGLSEGRYVAGQRLVESDLMRRFNVGRSTIREALKCLASEGIVKLELNRGAYIRDLSRAEVENLLRVIEVLMGLAGRLAAENINAPGAAARLRESYKQVATANDSQSLWETTKRRNAFLQTVREIGLNHELLRLMPAMNAHMVQLRVAPTTTADTRDRFYSQLTEAILAGDGDRAERVGRGYVRQARRHVARLSIP